jgi:hypothetical protein
MLLKERQPRHRKARPRTFKERMIEMSNIRVNNNQRTASISISNEQALSRVLPACTVTQCPFRDHRIESRNQCPKTPPNHTADAQPARAHQYSTSYAVCSIPTTPCITTKQNHRIHVPTHHTAADHDLARTRAEVPTSLRYSGHVCSGVRHPSDVQYTT